MTRGIWIVAVSVSMGSLGCGGEPTTADGFFARGESQYQDGEYDLAIQSFEKGLVMDATSAEGHHLLGLAYRMKYNTTHESEWKHRELDAFRAAVAADSTYSPAHVNLGSALFYLGKKKEAAAHFSIALELDPENPSRAMLEDMIRQGLAPPSSEPRSD